MTAFRFFASCFGLWSMGKSPVPIERHRLTMLWNSLKNNRDNEQSLVEWAAHIPRKRSVVMALS
jgi:hypothetical protein